MADGLGTAPAFGDGGQPVEVPDVGFHPTMPTAIRRAAAAFGDRDFLVLPDRRLTFAEAEATSREVAKDLVAAGIGKGSRVGIMFTQSTEWVVSWFAVTRIGAILVPFPSTMKPPELRRALRHSDVALLVVPTTLLGKDMYEYVEGAIPELGGRGSAPHYIEELPYLRDIRFTEEPARPWASELSLSVERAAHGGPVTDALIEQMEQEVAPGDLMIIIYTSGATSAPKGVVHTHAAELRHGANLARNFGEGFWSGERLFNSLPFFWIGGLTVALLPALVVGETLLCTERNDPDAALDLIEAENADRAIGWPPSIAAIALHPTFPDRPRAHIPMLVAPPGSPADPDLRHKSLGMTETSGPHVACPPDEVLRLLPERLRGSFGAPLPGVHHRIVDPDTGEDVPEGDVGEILVRGYSLLDGMYKRERRDVFDEDGWYHTGDRGFFRDGYLIFLGRFSEMIKTAGANVAPSEVESAIVQTDPNVDVALVVGVPDPERGELVVAAVVPQPGTTIDCDALADRLRRDLATYKVPRRFVVTTRAELPWLPTGKADKRTLQQRLTAEG
jgi:acyl-CoA synthetase (AMP-forming)/AMP-acid ligase II